MSPTEFGASEAWLILRAGRDLLLGRGHLLLQQLQIGQELLADRAGILNHGLVSLPLCHVEERIGQRIDDADHFAGCLIALLQLQYLRRLGVERYSRYLSLQRLRLRQ